MLVEGFYREEENQHLGAPGCRGRVSRALGGYYESAFRRLRTEEAKEEVSEDRGKISEKAGTVALHGSDYRK